LLFEKEQYENLYDKSQLVYLTGDSDKVMHEIDPKKIYIIGGIVDHNRLQLATLNKANKQGIETAKLPIGKYLKLKTSAILSVNHSKRQI